MSRHFAATVLLEAPWTLDIDALAASVRRSFPQIGRVDAVPGQVDLQDSGVLRVDGGHVVVTVERTRCPPGQHTPKLKIMRAWDATDALARHTARLTISCGGRLGGLDSAEAYAAAVHFVTAACLPLVPALAVLWHEGHVLSAPDAFAESAEGLLRGRMPLGAWVSFACVVPRGFRQETALGMVTYGMRPLIGRELELAPRPCRPSEAHRCLAAVARRTLDQGLMLVDGLRLMETGGGYDVTVRERTFWLRRELSAFVLVAPDAVVEVESLRPRQRTAA